MKMKFWKWKNQTDSPTAPPQRTLFLNGTIAEESWFDDDITPQLFRDELFSGDGDVVVWINSPGGDCVAAAQIYNMLMDYHGNVTVKIDGIAASAASVIAMAGTTVLMSPVSMMMIHNPMTLAMGDKTDMQKAIEMLDSVKESIINAYEIKTGLSRAKISHLMDDETWMDAGKAVELGFADDILSRPTFADKPDEDEGEEEEDVKTGPEDDPDETDEPDEPEEDEEDEEKKKDTAKASMLFSQRSYDRALLRKLRKHKTDGKVNTPVVPEYVDEPTGRSVDDLMDRLNLLKF